LSASGGLKYGRKLQVSRKAKTGWKSREIGFNNYVKINDFGLLKGVMNYPAAEQRGIYKGIVTPQAAGN